MPSSERRSPRPRIRRVPVTLPGTESPHASWLRNMRFSGFSVVMLGIVVLFVVVLAPGLRTLIQQQQEITAKQAEVAASKQDVSAKKKDVARWDDPAYIEAQARDRLLYVYPGETSYLVMGEGTSGASAADGATSDGATSDGGTSGTGATTAAGTPVSTSVQTPRVDWVSAMLSSVLTAGLSTDTGSELVSPDITAPSTSGSGSTR